MANVFFSVLLLCLKQDDSGSMIVNTRRVCVTILAFALLIITAGAVSGYSLAPSSSQDTIDIIDQDIDSEYGSATISSVTRVTKGSSVSMEVTVAENDDLPNFQLRDRDNSILRLQRNVEDGSTITIDSSALVPSGQSGTTAGTYVASLWYDGKAVAAHPIVVQGYDISVSAPDTVEQGQNATITATLAERDIPKHSNLESVELVIGANDNVALRENMNKKDQSNEYSLDVQTDKLDQDTYDLYIGVRGDETTELGNKETLAISDRSTFVVAEPETESSESEPSDDTNQSEGDNENSSSDTETQSDTKNASTNNEENVNSTNSTVNNRSSSSSENSSTVDSTDSEGPNEDVIEPNNLSKSDRDESENKSQTSSSNDQTNLNWIVPIVSILLSVFIIIYKNE